MASTGGCAWAFTRAENGLLGRPVLTCQSSFALDLPEALGSAASGKGLSAADITARYRTGLFGNQDRAVGEGVVLELHRAQLTGVVACAAGLGRRCAAWSAFSSAAKR